MKYLGISRKRNGTYKVKFTNDISKYRRGLFLTEIESLYVTQLKVEKLRAERAPNLPTKLEHLANINKIRERYESLVSRNVYEASLDYSAI